MFLIDVGINLQVHTALRPRRPASTGLNTFTHCIHSLHVSVFPTVRCYGVLFTYRVTFINQIDSLSVLTVNIILLHTES
jgi:hypothetical protein